MSSVLDRPPIIRGDHVFLRPSEIGEKAEWSKGFGTDALRAICDFGFGEYHDAHIMSLLRGEWSALPHRPVWECDSVWLQRRVPTRLAL